MPDAPANTGLETLDYAAIVGYLIVTWWIAYRATRKTDDTEDFFLGGRSMPWFAVGLSIMATLLSTNTYLGAPGEMIKNGPAYFFGFLAYPLVIAIVIGLWVPFFMRLRLTSAYDYLEHRFDRRARIVGSVLFLGLRLGWMSMVVFTASKAMVVMVVPDAASDPTRMREILFTVVAAVGTIATAFACIGGMRAVIWTDVLQAAMLFGGVGVILGYVAWSDGSFVGTWWASVQASSNAPPKLVWYGWDIAERTTVLWGFFSILAWNSCTHCCDQVALQRYFATTSVAAARNSFLVNILSSSSIGMLLAFAGLALRYYYTQHAEQLPARMTPSSGADDLMPMFFVNVLPVGFGGLILVSFLCDALQTLSSGVNSIAAVLTGESSDSAPEAGRRGVWRARAVTLGVGAAVTMLAVGAAAIVLKQGSTIFDMMPKMFNMFLGPLAAMFMIGMFYRRATGGVVLAAVLTTQCFSTLWSWWGEVPWLLAKCGLDGAAAWWTSLLGVDGSGKPRTPTVMLAIAFPALCGLFLGWLFSRFFGRDDHPGVSYTRREVMKRPPPTPETAS